MEARALAIPAAPSARPLISSLDDLAKFDARACEQLFARGESAPLGAISGHPRGRMLAVPGFEAPFVAGVLRRFAESGLNVWEGKSFTAHARANEGRGFNRVRVPWRRRAFPFRTYATDSVIDGKPCLAISYDVPENPGFVRPTYDELRSVGNGIFLGRGMKKRSDKGPKLLVWFALDTNRQDRDPG